MHVRPASESDLETLKQLWLAFDRENPSPEYEDVDEAVELSEVEDYVREHIALVVENGEVAKGFVLARMRGTRHGWISDLYVSPDFRRGGAAGRLVRDAAAALRERGADVIELDVRPWNDEARAVYERWGFHQSKLTLATKAQDLEQRLSQDAPAPSHGLVFAQTDDETRVAKAVRAYVPRLGRSARTDVHPPANGWIAVDDELCSGDPSLLRRLAQELSVPHRRCRADARRGGGSGRAVRPLRPGLRRRRVLVAPRVPRAAAAGRRRRPEREPDRRATADRGRPGSRARRGEDRLLCR